MASNIFATYAPLYWEAGLPAIPLIYQEKRPAIPRWQTYSDAFPTKEDQQGWLTAFASGNIGLPMGPSSGLVAIDIDTEDPVVLQVLDRILPPSPWHRVGRKGRVQIYRWTGERTARIKDEDGAMICEILSKGTQFVLPPSIHPDTKLPYTANAELYEIAKDAPPLPMDFERVLKGALREAGVNVSTGGSNKTLSYVPAGARDATMVWMAGLLARGVLRGERPLLQALGEMQAWVENFVEKVVGDPLTVEKAQGKVIEFLIRDVTGEANKALPLGWDEGLSQEDIERLGLSFTEDDKTWSVQQILDMLALEFERHPDVRTEGRMSAINVALDRIVRSNPVMGPLDEGMVLKFIVTQQKGSISLTDLKKQLNTLRRGDIAGESHSELAEACLSFLKQYGDIRYDASKFWQWRGAAWVTCQESELLKIISENYGAYPAGKRQSDHGGILRVMKAVAAAPLRTSYVKGVNFANGYLTEKLELVPHAPDYGMTYTLPYRYTPEKAGHMPMFDAFLNDCWVTDADYGDKLLALQEAIGVSLMGQAPQFEMAFLLFGQAGSGKSVMQAIMKGLVPFGSSASIPPTDWGDRFLPAELFGKIINFAGELSESRPIPGDIFKKIVSGEDLTVQYKNGQPFSFEPEAANWFNSNFLPKTRDSSEGFNRRWLILEFNNRVAPSKRIIDLDQQILEHEREAIVAWAIQGYRRLIENGKFTMPTSCLALVEAMAADNNTVRHFLTSPGTRLMWGAEHVTSMAEMHTRYWEFMLSTGSSNRANLAKFAKMMKELAGSMPFDIEIRGTGEVFYLGVGIGK
ncbi:bifunctional DNA primase/polymerase [Ensifer sp. ENS04]|uniref:phage/plasmid primase, P4 family n=1 Tax=Ensifer sp. ENS04 TaxID=2769281 RepID=UPI001780349D|nr:phage/plasmid primase, P4 family [Ensifer sp. ENS04]MBD9544271.1 bifunctional DNA primase/polymerase [Ensifer sp. ENS04]